MGRTSKSDIVEPELKDVPLYTLCFYDSTSGDMWALVHKAFQNPYQDHAQLKKYFTMDFF